MVSLRTRFGTVLQSMNRIRTWTGYGLTFVLGIVGCTIVFLYAERRNIERQNASEWRALVSALPPQYGAREKPGLSVKELVAIWRALDSVIMIPAPADKPESLATYITSTSDYKRLVPVLSAALRTVGASFDTYLLSRQHLANAIEKSATSLTGNQKEFLANVKRERELATQLNLHNISQPVSHEFSQEDLSIALTYYNAGLRVAEERETRICLEGMVWLRHNRKR